MVEHHENSLVSGVIPGVYMMKVDVAFYYSTFMQIILVDIVFKSMLYISLVFSICFLKEVITKNSVVVNVCQQYIESLSPKFQFLKAC